MESLPTGTSSPPFHVEHRQLEQLKNCPRCGSSEFKQALEAIDHTVSRGRFTLTDCQQCGFRTTNPRPRPSDLGSYYESEDYISHSNVRRTLQDRLYQMARNWALKRKYALVNAYAPGGRVLDIGCGTGEFLHHMMSRGYTVQGIEPSLRAREQAIANFSIDVAPSLDRVPAQEQFQLVTMWHVLEHMADPRATFKRLFALLADRGILVIAVPDRESWDASHFGSDWAAWDVPRHLMHFRRSDVLTMLHEHGFEPLATKRMPLDAFYIAMLSTRNKGAGTVAALFMGILLGTVSNMVSMLTNRPTSSSLFIARKAEF
jgi:SAM-dependent methyltransferase/predicted nucleic-acid-binding Zn-ribbon protein